MKIQYCGAQLEVPEYIAERWPYHYSLDDWPTFCGAGGGIGDAVIPDERCGVRIACVCFIHDIDWAIAEDTLVAAMRGNNRLRRNMRSIILANYDKEKYSRFRVEYECFKYYIGTTLGFALHFSPTGSDPSTNPEVAEKLERLMNGR
jgi:hypothetical protein